MSEKQLPQMQQLKLHEIEPYENNPRKNKDAIEIVKTSIKEFDFLQPIVVDSNKVIVVGHTRYFASQEMGLEKVPVIVADHLNPAQAKAYRIMDNKSGEFASWNYGLLTKEIVDLLEAEYDPIFTGFSDKELQDIDFDLTKLGYTEGLTDEEEVPEIKNEPITKDGDVWIMGNHRLLCGDSTSKDSLNKLMDNKKAEMVFTDPPYGLGFEYNEHKDVEGDEYLEFCDKWFPLLEEHTEFIFLTAGWKYNEFWIKKSPTDIFYWLSRNKQSGGKLSHFRKIEPIFLFGKPQKKYNFDWFDHSSSRVDVDHTCPKPVAFIEEAISIIDRDSIVLDVFVGSGSTVIACEKTSKHCYGIEIDPYYCDVIVQRWQNFTGSDANLDVNNKTYNEMINK